jgi:hypothetical protein
MSDPAGEAPSNWLSKKIEEIRRSITRFIPAREQRAERNAIVAAIKADPRGAELARHRDLEDVVWAALALANHVDREQQKRPMPQPSAAIRASWLIYDELGVERPEAES